MEETKKCLDLDLEHDFEFKTAQYGVQLFRCKLCKEWIEEIEDSQP